MSAGQARPHPVQVHSGLAAARSWQDLLPARDVARIPRTQIVQRASYEIRVHTQRRRPVLGRGTPPCEWMQRCDALALLQMQSNTPPPRRPPRPHPGWCRRLRSCQAAAIGSSSSRPPPWPHSFPETRFPGCAARCADVPLLHEARLTQFPSETNHKRPMRSDLPLQTCRSSFADTGRWRDWRDFAARLRPHRIRAFDVIDVGSKRRGQRRLGSVNGVPDSACRRIVVPIQGHAAQFVRTVAQIRER